MDEVGGEGGGGDDVFSVLRDSIGYSRRVE